MKSEIQGICICTKHRLIQVIMVGEAQPTISGQGRGSKGRSPRIKGPTAGVGFLGGSYPH